MPAKTPARSAAARRDEALVSCASSFEGASWRCPACGWEPAAVGELYRFYDPEGIDGFQPDAFDRLAAMEEGSFWFRSRTRLINWALGQFFLMAQTARDRMRHRIRAGGIERVYRRSCPGGVSCTAAWATPAPA